MTEARKSLEPGVSCAPLHSLGMWRVGAGGRHHTEHSAHRIPTARPHPQRPSRSEPDRTAIARQRRASRRRDDTIVTREPKTSQSSKGERMVRTMRLASERRSVASSIADESSTSFWLAFDMLAGSEARRSVALQISMSTVPTAKTAGHARSSAVCAEGSGERWWRSRRTFACFPRGDSEDVAGAAARRRRGRRAWPVYRSSAAPERASGNATQTQPTARRVCEKGWGEHRVPAAGRAAAGWRACPYRCRG